MKKYLIFTIGEHKDPAMLQYILDSISEIMDSDVLKVLNETHGIVVNFGSNKGFNELKLLLDNILIPCNVSYFIVEYLGNFSANMTEDELEYFSDLSGNIKTNPNYQQGLTTGNVASNKEEIKLDTTKKAKKVKKVTTRGIIPVSYDLDAILEKIHEFGLASLTNEELKYLDSLGQTYERKITKHST